MEENMKSKYRILYFLMYFPLAITLILFPFFPARIPAHYDIAGNTDRWGSKYELFIIPIFIIIFGYFMILVVRAICKKDAGENNIKALLIITSCSILVFNIMCFIFLYKAFFLGKGLHEPVNIDESQIIFIVTGIFLCLAGNILPKCKMNSFIGLRTTWSMKNEKAWSMSQRYGGISLIVGGICLITVNLFLKGIYTFIYSMTIFIIILIACIIISYISYKKSINDKSHISNSETHQN